MYIILLVGGNLHILCLIIILNTYLSLCLRKLNPESELPLEKHPAVAALSNLLDFNHNCGYLTFANVGVLDFGRPQGEATQVHLRGNLSLIVIAYQHFPSQSTFFGKNEHEKATFIISLIKDLNFLLHEMV